MDLPLSGGYWRGGWRKRFSSAYFDCDPAYFILHHYPVRCSAFDARTRAGHTAQDHADGIVRDLNTDAAVYGERNTTVAPEYDASINTDHDPLPASLRMSTQNHVPMCGHRNDVHRAMHANMRDSVKSSPRHFPNHTALQLITRPLTLTAFECNTHTQRTFIEQKIRMLFPRHTHTIVHHSAFYSIALVIPMHMELEAELKFIDNAIDNKCTTETREYDISHHNYDCNNNSENNGNNNNNNCSSNDDKKHKHAGKEFSSNNIFSAAATSKVLSTVACTLVQTLYKERARDDNTNANSNMGARANTNVNSITGCNSGDQSSTRMKMSLMDQKYEQQAHVRLVFPTKGEYTLILRTRRRTPAPHNSDSESKAIKPGYVFHFLIT